MITLAILCVFVYFSSLISVLIVFAAARSSQVSRWEEGAGEWAGHEREPESQRVGELRSETATAS